MDELRPPDLQARPIVQVKGLGSAFLGSAHVETVCHRLDAAGYRETAELIRTRPPTGAVLTRQQLVELQAVVDEWMHEGNPEELEDIKKLREELATQLEIEREET